MSWFDQNEYEIKFEWGLEGAKRLSIESDVIVVVDVLSFTTCVEAALSKGALVYPYLFKDARAQEYATSVSAKLASTQRSKTDLCLSPPSLLQLHYSDKVVLPSPNGSTICFSLPGRQVFAGCLRNARAVAKAAQLAGRRILVIASGERWPNDELRPSIEDLLGAGAILSEISGERSPEAEVAVSTFQSFERHLVSTIRSCSSGRELIEKGFPEDVEYAVELNSSVTVPILSDKVFVSHSERA